MLLATSSPFWQREEWLYDRGNTTPSTHESISIVLQSVQRDTATWSRTVVCPRQYTRPCVSSDIGEAPYGLQTPLVRIKGISIPMAIQHSFAVGGHPNPGLGALTLAVHDQLALYGHGDTAQCRRRYRLKLRLRLSHLTGPLLGGVDGHRNTPRCLHRPSSRA